MDSQSQNTLSPTSATASGDPIGATQTTNATSQDEQSTAIVPAVVPAPEPKLPSRKDVSLAEFTKNLKNVKSIVRTTCALPLNRVLDLPSLTRNLQNPMP